MQFEYGLEGMLLTTSEGNEGGQNPIKEGATGTTIPVNKQTRGLGPNNYSVNKVDENLVLDKDVLLYAPELGRI